MKGRLKPSRVSVSGLSNPQTASPFPVFVLNKMTKFVVRKTKTYYENITFPQRSLSLTSPSFLKFSHVIYQSERPNLFFDFNAFCLEFLLCFYLNRVFHAGGKAGCLSISMVTASSWFQ